MNNVKTYKTITYKGRMIIISYNCKGDYYRFCAHVVDPNTNKAASYFKDFHRSMPTRECYEVTRLWMRRKIDKYDSSI